MNETSWRARPAALADVGNNTGLVTAPRDFARFGTFILHGGLTEDGRRIVSKANLDALLMRSRAYPAFGRL
jgi:CubicO group peptidase (beta-lactamase class C family)